MIAPENWRGALPITYRIGTWTLAGLRLEVVFKLHQQPLYNVIARIPGSRFPTTGSFAAITTTPG